MTHNYLFVMTFGLMVAALSVLPGCGKRTPSTPKKSPAPTAAAPKPASPKPDTVKPAAGRVQVADQAGDWAVVKAKVDEYKPKISKQSAAKHAAQRKAALAKVTEPSKRFKLVFGEPEDEAQEALLKALKEQGTLGKLVTHLNGTIKLKRPILVNVTPCGEANAFFAPADAGLDATHPSQITLCVEFMEHMLTLFSDEEDKLADAVEQMLNVTVWTFFHELGHALVDNFQLPITGKEEDAVDRLATLMALSLGHAGGDIAMAGAAAFALEHDQEGEEGAPLWGEHALDGQRMFDILCIMYGSDPQEFSDLVGEDGLPTERAEMCQETFASSTRAWTQLLKPYLTAAALSRLALRLKRKN